SLSKNPASQETSSNTVLAQNSAGSAIDAAPGTPAGHFFLRPEQSSLSSRSSSRQETPLRRSETLSPAIKTSELWWSGRFGIFHRDRQVLATSSWPQTCGGERSRCSRSGMPLLRDYRYSANRNKSEVQRRNLPTRQVER